MFGALFPPKSNPRLIRTPLLLPLTRPTQTLDIAKGTFVVTASFGAERTLILREKKRDAAAASDSSHPVAAPRSVQRVPLPHNSLFVLGWDTNRAYTHEIKPDRRESSLKRPSERAYGGVRVSITFRVIATFLDVTTGVLTGQGAPRYPPTGRGDGDGDGDGDAIEYQRMIRAFSAENKHGADFDWDLHYGRGFYLG